MSTMTGEHSYRVGCMHQNVSDLQPCTRGVLGILFTLITCHECPLSIYLSTDVIPANFVHILTECIKRHLCLCQYVIICY